MAVFPLAGWWRMIEQHPLDVPADANFMLQGRPIPLGGTEPLPGRAAVEPRGDKVYDRVAGLASPARMNAILGQA